MADIRSAKQAILYAIRLDRRYVEHVIVIGGGLAGCECALQLARRHVPVLLYEQRPQYSSEAHSTDNLAELVCSNSFKSVKPDSAAGLLKLELEAMGCFLLDLARRAAVPAGGALSVDREYFSQLVEAAIDESPYIELRRERVSKIPQTSCVIAAGPLCSDELFSEIGALVGNRSLSFYDAVAPIIDSESINMDICFRQSRWENNSVGDYINCPLDKDSYEHFWHELVHARRVIDHDFKQKELFCACQPIEEVARSGIDALRFGAMKPVGLCDPSTGKRPWAVAQLRPENTAGTAYNLVGFQTNLAWSEQKRVIRMICGLEAAEFFRYGVMHRNSYVDSPHVLDASFAIPSMPVRLAGQICGTEGYMEAIASGLLAAVNTYCDLIGAKRVSLPVSGAFGSLVAYATDPNTKDFQPMHVNFGLVPPLEGKRLGKRERYAQYTKRALHDLQSYIKTRTDVF